MDDMLEQFREYVTKNFGKHNAYAIRNTDIETIAVDFAKKQVKTCNKPAVSIALPADRDKLRICIMDAMIEAEYQDEQWHDEDTANLAVQKLLGESPIQYAK